MSAPNFAIEDIGGGDGKREDREASGPDRMDDGAEGSSADDQVRTSTTGEVLATTTSSRDVKSSGAAGDPSTTTVEQNEGESVTVANTSAAGEVESSLTVQNINDGGVAARGAAREEGAQLPATTVASGEDSIRVDQVDSVQEQTANTTSPTSADNSGEPGGGGDDGDGAAERNPLLPSVSGGGGGGGILGGPGGLGMPGNGSGGLLDTLTSPIGLVMVAVTAVALTFGGSQALDGEEDQ